MCLYCECVRCGVITGWFYTWYSTFPPGPGRGLTLWDPEFLASVGLIVPSIAYVLFNAKNLVYPEGTMANTVYLVVYLLVMMYFKTCMYVFALDMCTCLLSNSCARRT